MKKFLKRLFRVRDENRVIKKTKLYQLRICFKNSKMQVLENKHQIGLRQIYLWFLLRNSERYNVRYFNGQTVILRSDITKISLDTIEK